jgi:deoxyribose-phosphate aldolase
MINQYIDHTVLKAVATRKDIEKLCAEAKEYNFYSVCVNSCWVPLAAELLKGSKVHICSVIGFPLGAMSTESKIAEAKTAVEQGADEIDMVINIGWLKNQEYELVEKEITEIKKTIGNKVLKVIIETCYLTESEKISACKISVAAHADFVKTSTGFGTGGATFEDVKLMLDTVERKAKVKASGGVRDAETAKRYIEMGVMRLGTSNGISIVKE